MHGSRLRSAISCARRCFFTVIGKYVPPFTVASLATTTTSRPATRPTPVTIPAPGAAPSYRPWAASGESSRNGEPRSSSRSTRSRGSSLPRATWRSAARGPPPARASASCSRRSSTSARCAASLAAKAPPRRLTALSSTTLIARTGLPSRHRRGPGDGARSSRGPTDRDEQLAATHAVAGDDGEALDDAGLGRDDLELHLHRL